MHLQVKVKQTDVIYNLHKKQTLKGTMMLHQYLDRQQKVKQATRMDTLSTQKKQVTQLLVYQLVKLKTIQHLQYKVKHMNILTCTQVWQRQLEKKVLKKLLIGLKHQQKLKNLTLVNSKKLQNLLVNNFLVGINLPTKKFIQLIDSKVF